VGDSRQRDFQPVQVLAPGAQKSQAVVEQTWNRKRGGVAFEGAGTDTARVTIESPQQKTGATRGLLRNAAIRAPVRDHGFTGATRIKRRIRAGASAAAIMETAPPCEVPKRSHDSMPTESRNISKRSALASKLHPSPGGRSENPTPNMSTACTVACCASTGMA
jgi:hypothetical protein